MSHLGAIISYGLTVTSGVPHEEQGLVTGLVTTIQQVGRGLTVGIPLLGVLSTPQASLFDGVRTVLAVDAAIVAWAWAAAAPSGGPGARPRRRPPPGGARHRTPPR